MVNNDKHSKSGAVLTWLFIGISVLMLCLIGLRLVTSKVLTQRLGMQTEWTDFVLSWNDLNNLKKNREPKPEEQSSAIDWATLYPFEDNKEAKPLEQIEQSESLPVIERFREKVVSFENNISAYATDLLPGYNQMTETANKYENAIKWNYVSY